MATNIKSTALDFDNIKEKAVLSSLNLALSEVINQNKYIEPNLL